ncbi:MAG: hypothetical protein ACKO5K_16070 [Armatimonadota bacterium]
MGYELPPEEKAKLRKVENVLMVVFGTIILAAIFGVFYSRLRPLPRMAAPKPPAVGTDGAGAGSGTTTPGR